MIWLLLGGLCLIVVVVCACRVSGDADDAAARLEQNVREER